MPKNATDIGSASASIAKDLRSLASHAEALIQATKSASGEGVEAARQQLTDSLKAVKKHVNNAESRALEEGRAAVEATSKMIRDKPWHTLTAALVVGVVVGCWAGKMHKSASTDA